MYGLFQSINTHRKTCQIRQDWKMLCFIHRVSVAYSDVVPNPCQKSNSNMKYFLSNIYSCRRLVPTVEMTILHFRNALHENQVTLYINLTNIISNGLSQRFPLALFNKIRSTVVGHWITYALCSPIASFKNNIDKHLFSTHASEKPSNTFYNCIYCIFRYY